MKIRWLIAGGALALAGLGAGAAQAQTPDCNDATMVGPNPIYLAGSSAFQPAIQAIAAKLRAVTGADAATLVYRSSASCDGVNFVTNNSDLSGTATYWTLDATTGAPMPQTCNLVAGTKADVGISDIFYETCPGVGTRPATIGDFAGPAQAMLFIAPEANTTNTNLTAEEARLIWGCGMAGMVSPFTDDNGIMQRGSGSGTQNIIAKHIGVNAASFKGKMNGTGGDLVNALLAYAAKNPGKAIGFLAADSYDSKRSTLNALAFRGFDQTKAYYADSAADKFDKRNVRDGHYLPWGPEHMIVALGADGKPSNPKAVKWLGWLDGSIKLAGVDFEREVASVGVIPQCAMKVTRSADGGFLSPFKPADPCGCFFESVVTKTATPDGCTACTDDSPCAASGKTCHHNFCE